VTSRRKLLRTIGELPAQSHCDRVGNFVPAGHTLRLGRTSTELT
jgi:hypothetical protein